MYIIIDTSSDWDLCHFLTTRRDEFINDLNNMVKIGYLRQYKLSGNAVIYSILRDSNIN